MAFQFDRVAQLRVPKPTGKTGVGSGYLLADRLVLTAGHVVDEAAPGAVIDLAFPAAGAAATGRVVWAGRQAGLDAALVGLDSPPAGPMAIRVSPVRWGRLTGQRPGVPAYGIGFPRALREEGGERVPDQVDGTINPGTAFGQRYDLRLTGPHPLAEATDRSPWAGLSGAAVFSSDLFIGVAVIDVPNFQSGRLTAVPAWRPLADDGFRRVLEDHGCAAEWESVELAGLFERPLGRRDSPASLLRADTAVVPFRGRDQILADLRSWCESEDNLAGMLIVGPGGQGKTRLAHQLCHRLRTAGWVTGFASPKPGDPAVATRLADRLNEYNDPDTDWFSQYVLPVLARYSGRQLAHLLNVDRRTIDRIRRGQRPHTDLAQALTRLAADTATNDLTQAGHAPATRVRRGLTPTTRVRRSDDLKDVAAILTAWRRTNPTARK